MQVMRSKLSVEFSAACRVKRITMGNSGARVANIDKTLNISVPVCTMVISQFGATGLSQGFWGVKFYFGG